MLKTMHIRLGNLQLSHQNGIEQSYYSIQYAQKHYFTSSFDHQNTNLQDDILIDLESSVIPQTISLQRWQNCMIIFTFDIDITQLRSRPFTKKTIETKYKQYVHLDIQIYQQKDILWTDKYIDSISQHYLIIQDLYFAQQKYNARASKQPNYFTITTKHHNYVVPLRQAVVLIKLPDQLQITSFINNVYNGKSGNLQYQKLQNNKEISIDKDMRNMGNVKLKIKWAINLHRYVFDQNTLLQSNQLMLYDFELKFDNPTDIVGCHLKIVHSSKAFDFSQDIDRNKLTKIKKVIFFIIKSQAQEVNFILQKAGKVVTYCMLNTAELKQNQLSTIKKKWSDMMNPTKHYGFIKFRGQRSKNLSIPQTNRHWRQILRRKHNLTNMMISIHQTSVYYQDNQHLTLVGKVENQEKMVSPVANLNYYEEQDQPSKNMMEFAIKGQENVYLIIKTDAKSNDFCGIGTLNTTQLKLGTNVFQVPFFKNQQKVGTVNCLITKMVFWPFLKPLFQNEMHLQPQQTLCIDIFFNHIKLTPYFYTYRYDGKDELYCIVEVNKVKRVLILEKTQHDPLSFFAATGSDMLNYTIDKPDLIKVKITFLVSDFGQQQQIYGTSICKIKGSQVYKQPIKLKNLQIHNDYQIVLGSLSFEISKGASPLPPKNKTAGHQKQRQSFDLSQASFDTNLVPQKTGNPSRRYSGGYIKDSKPVSHNYLKKNTHPGKQHLNDIKLPVIKQRKDKDSFKDLLSMMKVRKRHMGGKYQENGIGSPKADTMSRKERHSFDLKRLEQSNPNINHNLEILFPKKGNEKYIQMTRSKQNDYQQRLKGLKSVMNEISDIGEVQPSIPQSNHEQHQNQSRPYENQEFYEPQPEWQGNEFANQ